ncbi:MAG: hypothetical protein WC099_01100 [Candidatus Paceibacterota bacterium]
MKKLVLVALFVILSTSFISAQTFNLNGINAEAHVFAGMNIPTQDVSKDQFKFDYMRLHVDLSNDQIKVQFRHDFSSGKIQLANVSKTFGNFTVTAGRFLDPIWYLFPAPHMMSQTAYASSVNSFTVLDDGISMQYDDVFNDKKVTARISVFDCDGNRNVSASVDVTLSEGTHIGYFLQTRGNKKGFGLMAKSAFHSLLNVEGGIVSRPTSSSAPVEFYAQNQAKLTDKISVWLQGDFEANSSTTNTVRTMVGAAYQYSTNSHLKLFYNFTEKLVVAKVTFFL